MSSKLRLAVCAAVAISVTGCASRIPDGALVEVDGGAGTVTLL